MNKTTLGERDICTKFITPALREAVWDEMLQNPEEVGFTKGRSIVRDKLATPGKGKTRRSRGEQEQAADMLKRWEDSWAAPLLSRI